MRLCNPLHSTKRSTFVTSQEHPSIYLRDASSQPRRHRALCSPNSHSRGPDSQIMRGEKQEAQGELPIGESSFLVSAGATETLPRDKGILILFSWRYSCQFSVGLPLHHTILAHLIHLPPEIVKKKPSSRPAFLTIYNVLTKG